MLFVSPGNSVNHKAEIHLKNEKVSEAALNFDGGDSEERQFSNYFKAIKVLGRGAFGKVVMAEEISTNQ